MSVPTTTTRRAIMRLVAVLVGGLLALPAVLAGSGTAAAQAAPAPTNPSGFVRLGHLAPEVGPVDVYLAPFGGQQQAVIEKAAYGLLTDYQTLQPGDYTVAMRSAGSPVTSDPMLSASVTIGQGSAYTVLATSDGGTVRTTVIDDDLTPPAADTASVRLVQGSTRAQNLTVTAVDGPTLARDVAYGTATGYADVPQGRWTLRVTAADGSDAMASAPVVDLAAGTVNSLLVVNSPDGGFTIMPVVDAAGINTAIAPAGGVETGAGGTATDVTGSASVPLGVGFGAALVLLTGSVAVLARRRTVRVPQ